MPFIKII